MAAIRFDGITKVFGEVVAVSDFSLEAADGEFLVLVGPSGSGKTTALRILAGLEGVTGGEVWIGDRIVTQLRPQDRDIAMVFQDYALYPQMTVERNMGFALRNKRVAADTVKRKVYEAAERLGIESLLARKPSQLSGGQRQRVALGRAIVREPSVFLMDEPLSNLDASLRVQMRGEIKRLQRELGTTTVFVTHDQVEAMTMGDRIAVMRDGSLRQAGAPADIYARPADRFVGGFIGSPGMSFANFSAEISTTGVVLRGSDCQLAIGQLSTGLPDNVVVGARPEDALEWSEGAELLGPIRGTVTFVEDLGREWFAGVAFGDDSVFTIRGAMQPIAQIGDVLSFGIRPAGLYLFDATDDACLYHPRDPVVGFGNADTEPVRRRSSVVGSRLGDEK